jgi:hypothetical protein
MDFRFLLLRANQQEIEDQEHQYQGQKLYERIGCSSTSATLGVG